MLAIIQYIITNKDLSLNGQSSLCKYMSKLCPHFEKVGILIKLYYDRLKN